MGSGQDAVGEATGSGAPSEGDGLAFRGARPGRTGERDPRLLDAAGLAVGFPLRFCSASRCQTEGLPADEEASEALHPVLTH
jgi:hypothetical protein